MRTQKNYFGSKIDEQEKEIDGHEKSIFEKEMSAKEEAAKKIAEAEKKMAEILNENRKKGIDIPADIVAKFNLAISKAKAAFDAGNYDEARNLAKDAKKIAAIGQRISRENERRRWKGMKARNDLLGDDAIKAREHPV